MSDPGRDRQATTVVLVLVLATGIIDAASLLHLGTFTAYITGSLVLLGAHLAGTPGSPVPAAIAIGSFLVGAAVAAWLGTRRRGRAHLLVPLLSLDAALIVGAALVAGVAGVDGVDDRGAASRVVVAVLGLAMGAQTSAVRALRVPEVPMAAGTLATHTLVTDLVAGSTSRDRDLRRLAVVVALVAGAALGAALGRWEPWAAWVAAAAVVAVGAVLCARIVEPTSSR